MIAWIWTSVCQSSWTASVEADRVRTQAVNFWVPDWIESSSEKQTKNAVLHSEERLHLLYGTSICTTGYHLHFYDCTTKHFIKQIASVVGQAAPTKKSEIVKLYEIVKRCDL